MSEKMLFVGFCRICDTGPLGLRICGGCSQIVVLCDECDAVWTSDDLDATAEFTNDSALPCPTCSAPLVGGESRWATPDDIEQSDWLCAALNNGTFSLEEGAAFELGDESSTSDNEVEEDV